MTKHEKLANKARQNPHGLSFDEFENFLKQYGWIFKRQSGSHRVSLSPNKQMLPIQPKGGKAKAFQVKQALLIMENENG
ncbi:MAG: type II toxin-antitoxin system HicA family toxin [Betaproteobacteria bacterium]|nr:type II toxin-antitoxin system HicA family toxin [Betaproteobacteria bacterium]